MDVELRRELWGMVAEWGISSAGRAPALQAGGRRFDPVILHQRLQTETTTTKTTKTTKTS